MDWLTKAWQWFWGLSDTWQTTLVVVTVSSLVVIFQPDLRRLFLWLIGRPWKVVRWTWQRVPRPTFSRLQRSLAFLRRYRASGGQLQDESDRGHPPRGAGTDSITAEWVDGTVQGWSRAKWQLDISARTAGPIALDIRRISYWPVGAKALQRERGLGRWKPQPIGEGREREAGTVEFPLDWIPREHRHGQEDATGLVEIYAEVNYDDQSTGRAGTVTAGPQLIKNVPPLTPEARALLLEAANDPHGTILRAPGGLGGSTTDFQTNGRTFATEGDPRAEATWEGALKRLEQLDLVRDQGRKREVFKLTDNGYRVADSIGATGEEDHPAIE